MTDEAQPQTIKLIVVEDEAVIRMMAVYHFEEIGFDVLEAGNAHEAISLLETEAGRLHVIFTDVHMPGTINGIDLVHHVRRLWPWIGILIASGRPTREIREMPEGCRFLAKPYRLDEVTAHIRELAAVG